MAPLLVLEKEVKSKKMKNSDISNKTFGYWKVQEEYIIENGRKKWKCICQCGKQRMVDEDNLIRGRSKSCGCRNRKSKRTNDLKGQRFGRLLVKYPTKQRSYKGCIVWHCQCVCGKEKDIPSDELIGGHHSSCGCKKEEWSKQINATLHRVGNTCIEYLEKRNHRNDNKSGYQGVFQLKNGRYRSTIGFNGKRYHLGYYDTYEEAIKARKEGEEKLHNTFLEYYYQWNEKAKQDEEWAKLHPIQLEVNVNKQTKEIDIKIIE